VLTNGCYRRKDMPFTITAVNCEVGWIADLRLPDPYDAVTP